MSRKSYFYTETMENVLRLFEGKPCQDEVLKAVWQAIEDFGCYVDADTANACEVWLDYCSGAVDKPEIKGE